MLLEGAFVEQLQAEGAGEVLWMPLATHGRHTFSCNTCTIEKEVGGLTL